MSSLQDMSSLLFVGTGMTEQYGATHLGNVYCAS